MSDEGYSFETEFQAVFIPKQKPPPEPAVTGEMGASISSHPPLGQVTQLKDGNLKFIVLLEIDDKDAQKPWEVALWHSSAGADWAETGLSLVKDGPAPTALQKPPPQKTRLYYQGALPVSSILNFTIKFRDSSDKPWRWTRDEQSIGDGTIVINSERDTIQAQTEFADVVKQLNVDLKVKTAVSQCPGTELWVIEAPVAAANGEESAYADYRLGVPWGGFLR
jgi:hypothetical protein